jgi:hypothetical protein
MVVPLLDRSNAFCCPAWAYSEHEVLFSNNEAAAILSMQITTCKGEGSIVSICFRASSTACTSLSITSVDFLR